MIKRLKLKFLLLSMTSLFVLLSIIVAVMNIINYSSIVKEADEVLSLLSRNQGTFPGFELSPEFEATPPTGERNDRLPPHMSPELPYESRYFSVLTDADGNIVHVETSRIASVNESLAVEYARMAEGEQGFEGSFRYLRSTEGPGTRITFLNCGQRLEVFRGFLLTSSLIALGGFLVVFLVVFFCSGRIIRPIAESYEKQKRFITDAGHEIKTPLTIISANVDLLEMEIGQHECLSDIQQQAKRLTVLTNDLVYLARMEESESHMQMIDFPISEIVQETALPFKAPMSARAKTFDCQIQPLLSMKGNAKAIEQLVSLLMDNALKYSPEGGRIALTLVKQNRQIILTVTNTTSSPIDREALPRVFDRFYRTDLSRNSGTGGHGIGLSVAKAIVTAHGGKISAFANGEHTFGITAVFAA